MYHFFFFFLVPPVPENVLAKKLSSSSIHIKWDKITDTSYGILLGYQLTYIELDYDLAKKVVKRLPLTTTNYTMTGLYYYWEYKITIGGYTRPGVGLVDTKTVRTDEHSKCRIICLSHCSFTTTRKGKLANKSKLFGK